MSKQLISIIKIVLAVISFIASARLSFDLPIGETNIPITGQTLAILCWAVFMRPWEAFIAVVIYIGLGAYGMPVFADGASGMEVLKGNSGGYLFGFLVGAVVVAWIRDPYRKESIFSLLLLMLVGTVLILVCGVMRMSLLIGVDDSIANGFMPFWKGAIVKIVLGAIITYIIHMIIRAIDKPKKSASDY